MVSLTTYGHNHICSIMSPGIPGAVVCITVMLGICHLLSAVWQSKVGMEEGKHHLAVEKYVDLRVVAIDDGPT